MILSETIEIQISNNGAYWRERGYGPCKQRETITVKVVDLPPNSNKKVTCSCDVCSDTFDRQYQLINRAEVHRCQRCHRKHVGETCDKTESIKRLSNWKGENHPRWVDNKEPFIKFMQTTRWLSEKNYRANITILNPNNHPRTLCGVEGGYQLDHIVSIKKAYDLGWTPEQCADITNLQLLPWEDNRRKWK